MSGWRRRIFHIIFGVSTPEGRLFDIVLLWAIVISVVLVMLESVPSIVKVWGKELFIAEWFFTILFSLEYVIRIVTAPNKLKYIRSFYGIIDLLAVVPTYLALFLTGAQGLMVIRMLRLMRIFRIFKLVRFLKAAHTIGSALRASRPKITVFMLGVLAIVSVMGTGMYLIESGYNSDFTSIPKSIYWAIVTLTTVGYGDIAPQTIIGQFIASLIMITGYAIIAVPTGIVTAEVMKHPYHAKGSLECTSCGRDGHDDDALNCKYCGEILSSAD